MLLVNSHDAPRTRLAGAERREGILAAAATVLADRPYADMSVAQVAEAAGVSEALVFKHFSSKPELYAAALRRTAAEVAARRDEADRAGEHAGARDRVRSALIVLLDALAAHGGSTPFSPHPDDPPPVADARSEARAEWLSWLRGVLRPGDDARDAYALLGFLGFLDAACAAWRADGCPDHDRWPLIDAALGALEGGLGDWRR